MGAVRPLENKYEWIQIGWRQRKSGPWALPSGWEPALVAILAQRLAVSSGLGSGEWACVPLYRRTVTLFNCSLMYYWRLSKPFIVLWGMCMYVCVF